MFRILTIGDPHFMISNLDDVEIFIKRFINLVEEKNPDIIVILGDILHEHERLHISPLNKAISFIKTLSTYCPTYCLVGNHDMLNNKQFLTDNHWMNALKTHSSNIIIVDKVVSLDTLYGKFLFCPYVPPGQFQEAIDTYGNILEDNILTIFAHQEFYNCKMGAIISTEGDKWDINNPLVISGHIHSNQRPQKNVYYPGAALQHAFGESEKNIIAEIQYVNNNYEIIEHDLKLPRKEIKYVSLEELNKFTNIDTNNKTKLTIKCNYDDFKAFKKTQKYKELSKYDNLKIIHKPEKIKIIQENQNTREDIQLDNEGDFKKLLYDSLISEKNQYLISDFNYLFLNKNKDEEILII